MIINRQHWGWAAFVIVASALAVVLYLGEFHPHRLPFHVSLPAGWHRDVRETGRSVAGTPLGLAFGTVAAAIFVFAALLGARRKCPTWKVGRHQVWLKAHIWLTLLTVPLVLLHAGFSTGSTMTCWLLVLYGVVMVSGVYGLVLQNFLPRLMREQIPMETVFEQIPHILGQLRQSAEELRRNLETTIPISTASDSLTTGSMAASSGAVAVAELPKSKRAAGSTVDSSVEVLKQFLGETALPYLQAHRGERLVLGSQRMSDDQFRMLKISVSSEWQDKVEQLQAWCDERRQLDLQTKFQHWLHGWLLVHIPTSVLLILFTAWHVIAALFFY